MGIDIRRWSRQGQPIEDRRCILCGACVARCPRGTLRLEVAALEDAP
jgi:ferredoxin